MRAGTQLTVPLVLGLPFRDYSQAVTGQPRSFTKLKFKGDRFFGGAMPIDALDELVAYRDLIYEAARLVFFQKNPGRKNVPARFRQSMNLVVANLEDGSVVPVIALAAAISGASVDAEIFEGAVQLVQRTAEAAASGAPLPDGAEDLGVCFRSFGASLQPHEKMFLRVSDQPGGVDEVPFDTVIREKLLERIVVPDEEVVEVDWTGNVIAANALTRTFILMHEGYQRPFVVEEGDLGTFHDLFDWARDGEVVLVRGQALYRNGRFAELNMESVSRAEEDLPDDARLECSMALADQFAKLASLSDGWFDGVGTAYDAAILDRVRSLVELTVNQRQLPRPYVYPVPEGGVSVEWTAHEWTVDMLFDANAETVLIVATQVRGDGEVEKEFPVDERFLDDGGPGSLLAKLIKGDVL